MKKIHLVLLSDQQIPNLLSTLHIKPDLLAMVESAQMKEKKKAEHLLKALKLTGQDYSQKYKIIPITGEDSPNAIIASLKEFENEHKTSSWSVNLTGGTKPMSIGAYEFFKDKKAKLIYTELNKPNIGIRWDYHEDEEFKHKLRVDEFLAAYGFEIMSSKIKIDEAKFFALKYAELAKKFVLNCGQNDLSLDLAKFHKDLPNKARKKGVDFPQDMKPLSSLFEEALHELSPEKAKLTPLAVQFLTGGWLEVFCYNCISKIRKNAPSDLAIGIKISSDNELDVVYIRNNTFYSIECKTGKQGKEVKDSILYKIEAVVKQLKALRVKTFLAITSMDIYAPDDPLNIDIHIKNRALNYDCGIVDFIKLQQLAKNEITPEEVFK